MSELTDLRDYARQMSSAEHQMGCKRARRVTTGIAPLGGTEWFMSCDRTDGHEEHLWTSHRSFEWRCLGLCGGCGTDAERALWAAQADEIERYLAGDDEQEGMW